MIQRSIARTGMMKGESRRGGGGGDEKQDSTTAPTGFTTRLRPSWALGAASLTTKVRPRSGDAMAGR